MSGNMILRDVGAVQLDMPVEDADLYPDISKDKGKTRTKDLTQRKGRSYCFASELRSPLFNVGKR